MKFGLYYTINSHKLIRCIDEHFDCIPLPSPRYGLNYQAIIETPGKPCSQETIKTKLRREGCLLTPSRPIAQISYDVPDNVDLYAYGDFGVCK